MGLAALGTDWMDVHVDRSG